MLLDQKKLMRGIKIIIDLSRFIIEKFNGYPGASPRQFLWRWLCKILDFLSWKIFGP